MLTTTLSHDLRQNVTAVLHRLLHHMLPSTSAKHLLATLATALGCAWERDRCWPPRLRRRGLRRLHQMSAELHSLRTACFYHLMNTRLHSPFTPCFHHRLRCSIAGTDASSLGFIEKNKAAKNHERITTLQNKAHHRKTKQSKL